MSIPQPPNPKVVNRPIKPRVEGVKRPRTNKLMESIRLLIKDSDGQLSNAHLATHLGVAPQSVSEWLVGFRSTPNSETTLDICAWVMSKKPKAFKEILKEVLS